MADKTTRRVLRLNSVTSAGALTSGVITLVLKDPASGEELRDPDTGEPDVVVFLKPVTDQERREVVKQFTTLEKDPNGGRALVEVVDQTEVTNEIMRRAIDSWDGIAGSDDRPLVCTAATKALLDGYIKAQISRKLFSAEAVQVAATAFR